MGKNIVVFECFGYGLKGLAVVFDGGSSVILLVCTNAYFFDGILADVVVTKYLKLTG